MKNFDFYEFTGILAPGTVTIVGLALIFPKPWGMLNAANISMGEFGILIILAYVAGHLTQAIGNFLEIIWWKIFGGMPTSWVKPGNRNILSEVQLFSLKKKVQNMLGMRDELTGIDSKKWYCITRQINAEVENKGNPERIKIFNANYGLNRGIAAALFLDAILILTFYPLLWKYAIVVLMLFAIAIYRMHRFAIIYARELYVQYLTIKQGG